MRAAAEVRNLPIRRREHDARRAVASFIANHAALSVLDALASQVADQVRPLRAEVVVGLPTLGLALAPPLARALGQDRFVPFGTSRKYWYDEALSAPTTSITTASTRRLYVDPHLVPLLRGRRVLLVDDTISTGTTALAALAVLSLVDAEVVGLAFAMSQGDQWRRLFAERAPASIDAVSFLFATPHLQQAAQGEGWVPVPATGSTTLSSTTGRG